MDIGIGLPTTVPGLNGKAMIEWARRAEACGFQSVAAIDRLVYDNCEPMLTLAGAAAVTQKVRLMTAILIAPYRANTALLAKEIATLDSLSGGRFVLGLGLGGRDDDYTASGLSPKGRGRRLNEQIAEFRRIWAGEKRGMKGPIGPRPSREGGPEMILGGASENAFKRAARFGDGWIMGSAGGPDVLKKASDRLNALWSEAGRSDKPRLLTLRYYAFGADAKGAAERCLGAYYPEPYARHVIDSALTSEQAVRDCVTGFEAAGCNEMIFFCCAPDINQVDRLADILGMR